jgi:hypothetical protein
MVRRDPKLRPRIAGFGSREVAKHGIDHRVADEVHATPVDVFAREVFECAFRMGEEDAAEVVG